YNIPTLQPHYPCRGLTASGTALRLKKAALLGGIQAIALIDVQDVTAAGCFDSQERALRHCERLENGDILLLKRSPLLPSEGESAFLFRVRQTDSRYPKNIAYRPGQDRLTGFSGSSADAGRLRQVLRAYSQRARQVVTELFAPHAQFWQFDLTSFRPLE